MNFGLMAGLLSVPAFPVVGFVLIWVGVSPLAICSVPLPLCSIIIIVMSSLKGNLGFC